MSTLKGTTMHPRCRHIGACWDLLENYFSSLAQVKIQFRTQPFNTQENTGVNFRWNFNSILRRDHQKKIHERRAYESVDEKSLS